jgi:hypothetical protein
MLYSKNTVRLDNTKMRTNIVSIYSVHIYTSGLYRYMEIAVYRYQAFGSITCSSIIVKMFCFFNRIPHTKGYDSIKFYRERKPIHIKFRNFFALEVNCAVVDFSFHFM